MKKVKVEFLQAGEAPKFGVFEVGDKAIMSKDQAEILEGRGVLKILTKNPPPRGANKEKTEVSDHGKE